MSLAGKKPPIAAVESALLCARVRYDKVTPEEKQLLLSDASRHVLSQLRSNPSLHVPEELDLQRAPDSAGPLSNIDQIKSELTRNAQLVRDFYYRAETTNPENRFQIALEFLIMLDEAARLAYRDRDFALGLTLLETSLEIFSRYWSDVTGEEKAKYEERTRTKFLHASIRIAINDFDVALEHIQGAIEYLDQGVNVRSEIYKGREWLLWGCKAEALDGKGCYDLAERYYRKALRLMPDNVKYTKYHVGLGRCLLSQGKTEEGRLHLQRFLIELEEKFDVDNKEFPLVGFTLYWLGNSCFDAGHLLEAIELHERAVLCLKSSLGEAHSIFGMASYELAMDYYNHITTPSFGVESLEAKSLRESALDHLETATKVFRSGNDKKYREAELTRALGQIRLIQTVSC